MNSKKKFIITVSSLCTVVVALIVALVVTLASVTQTVTHTTSITYNAIEVSGSLTMSTQEQTQSASQTPWTAHTAVEFDAEHDTDDQGTIQNTAFTFVNPDTGAKNRWVIYKFEFVNDGDADYVATLTWTETARTNVTFQVSTDNTTYANLNTATGTANNAITVAGQTAGTAGTATYYVKVSLVDVKLDASLAGTFSWTLEAQE